MEIAKEILYNLKYDEEFGDFKRVLLEVIDQEDHYITNRLVVEHKPTNTFWSVVSGYPVSDGFLSDHECENIKMTQVFRREKIQVVYEAQV